MENKTIENLIIKCRWKVCLEIVKAQGEKEYNSFGTADNGLVPLKIGFD